MDDLDSAIVLIPLLAVLAPLAARAIGPWLRIPVVVFELVLGIVVRGLPSILAAPRGADAGTKTATMLMGATGLPIIVAVTAIGVDQGLISSGLASVLVGAGMLSVLLFPLIAMSLRGDRLAPAAVLDDEA